jgi:flagellar biosynthesis protein
MSDTSKTPVKTPIAVALEYKTGSVPRVTAKGRGAVAEAIVAKAEDSGVHIEENAALAQALSQVELDAEIPEQLYRAVAVVISFVLRTGKYKPPT